MDATDRKIVGLLQTHGRMNHEQIAQAVNLSRPAVHERVRRMEESGVIKGYGAVIDWAALSKPMTAFISVRTSGRCDDTGGAILALEDAETTVEECHRVTGDWCLLVKARVASPLALQRLIDRIRAVPGVQATMTTLALSAVHEERVMTRRAACHAHGAVAAGT